jgi:ribose transport system permease protein
MSSAPTQTAPQPGIALRILAVPYRYIKPKSGILIGLFLMCTALAYLSPAFLTTSNALNVLRQVSTNANLAFGMTLAILIGGIDLSVGPVLAISGTLTAGLIATSGLPVWLAVLMGLSCGTMIGFFNGFIISRTGIAPFIVTLATMQIARGMAYVYTGGNPVSAYVDSFNAIGSGYLGPVPLPVIYTSIVFLLMCFLLYRTRFGRYVYALGGNRTASIYSGININRVQVLVYSIIGFLAAASGIVLCARMYSGQPTIGNGFELDAIAAVVLGGTSFSGGVGTLGGTLLGVFVIGILNNGLNLLNINSFWQLVIKGVVILLAVYVDILKKRGKNAAV